jgi:hypothetical protein
MPPKRQQQQRQQHGDAAGQSAQRVPAWLVDGVLFCSQNRLPSSLFDGCLRPEMAQNENGSNNSMKRPPRDTFVWRGALVHRGSFRSGAAWETTIVCGKKSSGIAIV